MLLWSHLLSANLALELNHVTWNVWSRPTHHLAGHHSSWNLASKCLLVALHLVGNHLFHHGVLLLLLLLLQEHGLVPLASNHLTLPMHHPLALLRHHLLGWGHPSSLPLTEGP